MFCIRLKLNGLSATIIKSTIQILSSTSKRGINTGLACNLAQKGHSRDHYARTAHIARQAMFTSVNVVELSQISNSVKFLKLKMKSNDADQVNFKAGQWVDMLIPGVETVGGFSICNSPENFKETQQIQLAVKFSMHPPAHWIHDKCRLGDEVFIRVGGDFMFKTSRSRNVLLIAGGVGINPLYSMFMHIRDSIKHNDARSETSGTTKLIYSAKTYNEILFKEKLQQFSKEIPAVCHIHVTDEDATEMSDGQNWKVNGTRVSINTLSLATQDMERKDTDCYICGPPSFIEMCDEYLRTLGVPRTNIYFEKWW